MLEGFSLYNISSYVTSPPFYRTFTIMKFLFVFVSVYFLISIIYFIMNTTYIRLRFGEKFMDGLTRRPYGVGRIDKVWAKIISRLEKGSGSDYKLSILESDGVLDEVLKKAGYSGKNTEERIKQLSPDQFPNLENLIEAHQVRNNIVRDPDYQLGLDEAKKIIAVYRKTFENLDVF